MNALEGECLCLCEKSININKLLAVWLLPVYFFIYFLMLMLLLHLCLFVDHVNKPIILVPPSNVFIFFNQFQTFAMKFQKLSRSSNKLKCYMKYTFTSIVKGPSSNVFFNQCLFLMCDLTDNQFYPSTERIWLRIRLNNARKYCDITLKIIIMVQNV